MYSIGRTPAHPHCATSRTCHSSRVRNRDGAPRRRMWRRRRRARGGRPAGPGAGDWDRRGARGRHARRARTRTPATRSGAPRRPQARGRRMYGGGRDWGSGRAARTRYSSRVRGGASRGDMRPGPATARSRAALQCLGPGRRSTRWCKRWDPERDAATAATPMCALRTVDGGRERTAQASARRLDGGREGRGDMGEETKEWLTVTAPQNAVMITVTTCVGY
ncbi:hypothetical protein GGX14DRAFT_391827 [Mycena pura]|uniref:Uncharacterized protein n=1 Tax=Mycena pura TaxID=153505 RepID=A0AAD6VNQ7_9AGAR|nr:hypothetical protein GGX14DRAFT_391827 [Mycena pura]